jgi:hypothetical protein
LYTDDTNKAILLPTNTSFDEKSIIDKNSALGSYFFKNYPEKIDATKEIIINEATKRFSFSDKKSALMQEIQYCYLNMMEKRSIS